MRLINNYSQLPVPARITSERPFRLCFVCLGNICRSPTAEGVFRHMIGQRRLESYFHIDSAGTADYHIGELPNSKSRMIAKSHGVELISRGRQLEAMDLEYFDLIVPMDRYNLEDVKLLDPEQIYRHKIILLRRFDPSPDSEDVPDPYYDELHGFERVYNIIERSCRNLLDLIVHHITESD